MLPSLPQDAIALRKPPSHAVDSKGLTTIRRPIPRVYADIWRDLQDKHIANPSITNDVSRSVAQKFRVSRLVVDWVCRTGGAYYERREAAAQLLLHTKLDPLDVIEAREFIDQVGDSVFEEAA